MLSKFKEVNLQDRVFKGRATQNWEDNNKTNLGETGVHMKKSNASPQHRENLVICLNVALNIPV